jgi:hypothetical protein
LFRFVALHMADEGRHDTFSLAISQAVRRLCSEHHLIAVTWLPPTSFKYTERSVTSRLRSLVGATLGSIYRLA